jgi:hypothetical protein
MLFSIYYKKFLTSIAMRFALRQNDFLRVLAKSGSASPEDFATAVYAWYRLGCYSKVISLTGGQRPDSARELCAILISQAACGRFEECAQSIDKSLKILKGSRKYAIEAARGLAKYRPDLALRICGDMDNVLDLRASLHFAMGDLKAAENLLTKNKKPSSQDIKNGHFFLWANLLTDFEGKQNSVSNQLVLSKLTRMKSKRAEDAINVLNLASGEIPPAKEGPIISIIVPAYNSEQYLRASVTSLLRQSYHNIEVVIVDDGSTDSTEEIARSIAQDDGRVRFHKLTKNSGSYVARNAGLSLATGEIVTVHDSDDFAHPQKIERQVRPLTEDPAIIFTFSDLIRISKDGIFGRCEVYPLQRLNTASLTFRREVVLRDCGVWEERRFGADSEFLFRLKFFYGKKRWKRIRQPLTFAADHSGAMTRSISTGTLNTGNDPLRTAYTEDYIHRYLDRLKNTLTSKS